MTLGCQHAHHGDVGHRHRRDRSRADGGQGLRISTQRRVFPRPLALDDALEVVDGWLGQPTVTVLHPTSHHHLLLAELLREVGVAGKLVGDAHLAALAIEHRATVISFDADFARFARVRWQRPTA
ncbi:MAG: TA system VapC family ribonuclease toxin [Dermatophilaceae bacterium]